MSYVSEILADAPLAYWRLNEASGATAADSSGNGNTATFSGTYTRNSTGLLVNEPDAATTVNGAGYAVAPYVAAFDVNNITIEGIIWVDGTTSGNIIDRDPETSIRIFQVQTGSTGLTFIWWSAAGGGPYFLSAPATGRTHFAFTLDNVGAKAYVNGVLVGSTAQTGGLRTGAEPIVLGAHRNGAFTQKFVGVMDEVAVYGSALSAGRILAHSNAVGSGPTDARVAGMYGEVLLEGPAQASMSSLYAEVLYTGPAQGLVSSIYSEILTSSPSIQFESVYLESLAFGTPLLQSETVYGEVVAYGSPQVQAETIYLEVISSVIAVASFKGWGVPI